MIRDKCFGHTSIVFIVSATQPPQPQFSRSSSCIQYSGTRALFAIVFWSHWWLHLDLISSNQISCFNSWSRQYLVHLHVFWLYFLLCLSLSVETYLLTLNATFKSTILQIVASANVVYSWKNINQLTNSIQLQKCSVPGWARLLALHLLERKTL